jgi:excisionase family DNA binding protein
MDPAGVGRVCSTVPHRRGGSPPAVTRPHYLYALLKADQIASVRIGRLRRIPTEALAAYSARLITEQHAARKSTRHDVA